MDEYEATKPVPRYMLLGFLVKTLRAQALGAPKIYLASAALVGSLCRGKD
jgi:hypothetical protein